MFCTHCGFKVEAQSQFCAKCGSLVASDSEPKAAKAAPETPFGRADTTEEIAWVLITQRKLSLIKRVACNLVFMKDKVIVAHLSPELQKAESAKISQEIKASGTGFFKGSAKMMQYWANYYKKYYSMNTSQILAEDPANFVLPYQSVKAVMFQCESQSMDEDGRSYGSQGKLNITMADGKTFKFSHSRAHDRTVKETLTRLLNGKLKYKR